MEHPLQSKKEYYNATDIDLWSNKTLTSDNTPLMITSSHFEKKDTELILANDNSSIEDSSMDKKIFKNEPNTALLSFILMFGTFLIAYGLKLFRNGKYMGRTVRKNNIL